MALRLLLAGTLVLAAVWSVQEAQGNFAASPGFSGRSGFTCVVCHQPPSPTDDDAKAILEGTPSAWDVNHTYTFTIRVEGGPPALPAPAPEGGFDIAVDGGRLGLDGQTGILRQEGATEVTYEPNGTLMRQWHVTWTAPDLSSQPAPIHVWLAVLAANGNHVVALHQSDLGEALDSTDALQLAIPASPAAVSAWNALPLAAPDLVWNASSQRVEGHHVDPLATGIRSVIDDQAATERATGADFLLDLSSLPAGHHTVAVSALGAGRASPPTSLGLDSSTAGPIAANPEGATNAGSAKAAGPSLLLVLGVLATLAITWKNRP